MEQKLTNSEVARVFTMYWGCEYLAEDGIKKNVTGYSVEFANDNEYKLLLSRLEDITDEDAIEVAMLSVENPKFKDWSIERTKSYLSLKAKEVTVWIWFDGTQVNVDVKDEMVDTYNQPEIQQLFTTKGYAVPLYFGVGHWANGLNAIELQIGIDKKTLK